MKKITSFVLSKLKQSHFGFLAAGFLFILVGIDTSATGKLPRGGIIYDDNLKIFYALIWFTLGLACIFLGVRRK
ncbi:hypothetical protein [Halomonas sp. SpR8]|uniref:hypothetical protein n=1 Tax=Halomonas sp. SpR8 TaxID=3050463 RepID=UPI0027E4CC40|nr:hypothetical protein [Halomonas sp. SpR8]MDQ7727221.1 hypothetical protein [Halomonas sp. SpR8]